MELPPAQIKALLVLHICLLLADVGFSRAGGAANFGA
jgi:hypothetical protein